MGLQSQATVRRRFPSGSFPPSDTSTPCRQPPPLQRIQGVGRVGGWVNSKPSNPSGFGGPSYFDIYKQTKLWLCFFLQFYSFSTLLPSDCDFRRRATGPSLTATLYAQGVPTCPLLGEAQNACRQGQTTAKGEWGCNRKVLFLDCFFFFIFQIIIKKPLLLRPPTGSPFIVGSTSTNTK